EGNSHVLFAHAKEPADSNDHSGNATLLVDHNSTVGRRSCYPTGVNILLVEIGHSGADLLAEEDLRWTGGKWAPAAWAKGAVVVGMHIASRGQLRDPAP